MPSTRPKGFLDWLLALAEKYLPLAVAAVFGMMTLATAVLKIIAALFRRRPRARRGCVTPELLNAKRGFSRA